ncbi:MAG: sensor histidine kinase [Chryseolinea sp.]
MALWIILFSFVVYLSLILYGWPQAIFRSVFIIACHLTVFYSCYSWFVPQYFENKKYFMAFGGLAILLIVLTTLRFFIEKKFILLPNGITSSFMANRNGIGFILFSEIALAAFAGLLRLATNSEESKQRMTELEKTRLETELRFLKTQMSPHFLFNTINNVYSLALIKSEKAPEALMKLSELLRYFLYECNDKVTLLKEINALESYSELFQLKYEMPLHLKIDDHLQRPDALIEPLLLIPLLENAVKHSGLGLSDKAYVNFTFQQNENGLVIRVENNKTHTILPNEASGIGLNNIKKRLKMLYPGKHELSIDETTDQFLVVLTLSL